MVVPVPEPSPTRPVNDPEVVNGGWTVIADRRQRRTGKYRSPSPPCAQSPFLCGLWVTGDAVPAVITHTFREGSTVRRLSRCLNCIDTGFPPDGKRHRGGPTLASADGPGAAARFGYRPRRHLTPPLSPEARPSDPPVLPDLRSPKEAERRVRLDAGWAFEDPAAGKRNGRRWSCRACRGASR